MFIESKKNFDIINGGLPYRGTGHSNTEGDTATAKDVADSTSKGESETDDMTTEPAELPKKEVASTKIINAALGGGVVGFVLAIVLKQKKVAFAIGGAIAGAGIAWMGKEKDTKSNIGGDERAFAAEGDVDYLNVQSIGDSCYKKVDGRWVRGQRGADNNCHPLGEVVPRSPESIRRPRRVSTRPKRPSLIW